jgi:hypothetical protein
LPGLTLNCNPPDFSLLSNQDYKGMSHWHPASFLFNTE